MGRTLRLSLAIFVLLAMAGCGWLKGNPPKSTYSFNGTVLNSARLKQGGTVYVLPFSAGVGVEANETLDEAALMLIKGIYEELSNTKANLVVLTSGKDSAADFILRGHFVKWGQGSPRGVKEWLIPGAEKLITIDGELVERGTGKTLAHFSNTKEASGADFDHRALGLEMGKNIGRFLLSAAR